MDVYISILWMPYSWTWFSCPPAFQNLSLIPPQNPPAELEKVRFDISLAKISAMEIREEVKRAAWKEIERVVKQAKFFVHAVRHDGEKVGLWLLPEGEVVKVVEMGDSPERKRLRVYLWKEEEFEQFSEKAMLNKRRWFKDWKIQSVHVKEKNWTEEEREMVEEWEEKGKLLSEFIYSFLTKNLTKETFKHPQYKHIVELPEDFWWWEFKKQVKFLIDNPCQKYIKEGKRKGYYLFLRFRS
jgi:hypothetical protein